MTIGRHEDNSPYVLSPEVPVSDTPYAVLFKREDGTCYFVCIICGSKTFLKQVDDNKVRCSSCPDTWYRLSIDGKRLNYVTHNIPCLPAVDHPLHYGGDVPHETYKCLRAWGLEADALLRNAVKYLSRAGKKGSLLEDLKKARWYLDRRIEQEETRGV
jgi:hypothetical protein